MVFLQPSAYARDLYFRVFRGIQGALGSGGEESRTDFAIILFVGMIVHGLFAECINRAPALILSNVNYVKKVVFPLEILPWVALGSALFHTAVSVVVLLLAQLILNHQVPWTAILFPFGLLPLVFIAIGFAWFLAAFGVFMRDIGQINGNVHHRIVIRFTRVLSSKRFASKYQSWLLAQPACFYHRGRAKGAGFGTTAGH